MRENIKTNIQLDLTQRWKEVKTTLDTLGQPQDIMEHIAQFGTNWLGGPEGGWIAQIHWTRDPVGETQAKPTITRDYRIHFRDWTSIDPNFPLRAPQDFADPFPPHNLAIVALD